MSEDEIPMVLLELNESALIYIQKEQFENALLLLQKAHGVLDVVDLLVALTPVLLFGAMLVVHRIRRWFFRAPR